MRRSTGAADSTGDPDEPATYVPSRAGADFAGSIVRTRLLRATEGDPRTLVLPLESLPSYVSSHHPVPAPPPSVPRDRNPMIIMIVILLFLTVGAGHRDRITAATDPALQA